MLAAGCQSAVGTRETAQLVVAALGKTTSGDGIPGATVTVRLVGSRQRFEQKTDRDGNAKFQIPQGAKFTVDIVLAGFVPVALGPVDGIEDDSYVIRAYLEVPPLKPVVVE
jgi:hypothetical protein